jgi:hypothetical protein
MDERPQWAVSRHPLLNPTPHFRFPTRRELRLASAMKHYPQPRKARHLRVPAFLPVPLRTRADGWTPARQAAFLAALAQTRSVAAAARRVGMARETAYRLRGKRGAESFAAAWDAVLGRAPAAGRKVTPEERCRRALEGVLKPRFWRAGHVSTQRKADNSALLGLLAQLERSEREAMRRDERSQSFGGGSAVHDAL